MLASEAIHHALAGHRKVIALALGVHDSLVDQWCLAPHSCDGEGKASPVQRVVEIVLALRLAGAAEADELLAYVCTECGCYPPVRIDAVPRDPADVQILAEATREHADILGTWSRALADQTLSVSEAEDFRRELRELHLVTGAWDLGLAQFIASEEAARISVRRGPKRAMPRYLQLRKAVAV